MGRCVIFGAAEFDSLLFPIAEDDCLIAADGGVRHLKTIGAQADLVLGDFDSLGYVPEGAAVFPVKKDDTDVMLALREGLKLGHREFLIYGGLGGKRLDHTVANFQALHFLRSRGARGYLVGKDYLVTVISGETASFPATADGVISLFCMGKEATGVGIEGLQYELENGTLNWDFPLGVSNHFIGKPSKITVGSGMLLLMWDAKNGLPTVY